MLKEYIDPFCNSFLNVMPMLGIEDVSFKSAEDYDKIIETPGVICIIGIIGDLRGNVIYAMKDDCAKKIASTMMCGMEVEDFDEIAQSAISELGNMLAANACTEFSSSNIIVDVSTPTLMIGDFSVSASFKNVTRINMSMENLSFYIYLSLEKK